jgi:TolB protein
MNADGSGATALTKLTNDLAVNTGPHWSPDGSKLAFESTQALDGSDAPNTNKTKNIWLVAANGSGASPLTRLTATGAVTGGPVWSPDGKRLAFNSARGLDGGDSTNLNGIVNVWVVKADGSGAAPFTQATASLANSFVNGWSPDGSTLAFASGQGLDGNGSLGLNNIWIINSDGSNSMPLTRLTMASSASPVWKP